MALHAMRMGVANLVDNIGDLEKTHYASGVRFVGFAVVIVETNDALRII